MLDTPCGTSTLNAYTSYLSRVQASGLPLALIFNPASLSIGPLGEWLPGSHFGYSRVSSPACTGMVSCARKIPWLVSLASTLSVIVPLYGVSCGGGMFASAASASAEPATKANASATARRVGTSKERRDSNDMAIPAAEGQPSNLAVSSRRADGPNGLEKLRRSVASEGRLRVAG